MIIILPKGHIRSVLTFPVACWSQYPLNDIRLKSIDVFIRWNVYIKYIASMNDKN